MTEDPGAAEHALVEPWVKRLAEPDEVLRLPGITEELVDLGDVTVGRVVQQPGWRLVARRATSAWCCPARSGC